MSQPDAALPDHLDGVLLPASGGQPLNMGDGAAILTAGAGSGRYRIDVERVPQAIADFRHAAAALRIMAEEALNLAHIEPPGLDAVSVNAVREIGEWAAGPEGSLRVALEDGATRLEEAAQNLEEQLKAYLQVEEINTVEPTRLEL